MLCAAAVPRDRSHPPGAPADAARERRRVGAPCARADRDAVRADVCHCRAAWRYIRRPPRAAGARGKWGVQPPERDVLHCVEPVQQRGDLAQVPQRAAAVHRGCRPEQCVCVDLRERLAGPHAGAPARARRGARAPRRRAAHPHCDEAQRLPAPGPHRAPCVPAQPGDGPDVCLAQERSQRPPIFQGALYERHSFRRSDDPHAPRHGRRPV